MRVIGTAGHVDHGKSTLVRALSGIDPDRLQEEKARGMTIDLGFAWIDLVMPAAPATPGMPEPSADPNATGSAEAVGIVDVPGHIDFIKNMLAGVGGIDAALLVIAADEGVMPQTREHLAILDLLAVPAAVVALTKIDRVEEPEWLDLVELDIHELLEPTHLAGAPIVRVSAATGVGLDDLRTALAQTLAGLPPRRNRARPRLPVDRVFSLSGLGTIVTGTLLDGQFQVGDEVEILPSGIVSRIRGLQTHKQAVKVGEPGSRLAINLAGIETADVRRGNVVARPGALHPARLVDVRLRLLPDAGKPLAHNQRVDFFCGASEVEAHARVLGVEQVEPGQEAFVQLRLDRPVAVQAGDRFILRRPSPSATLGGGVVVQPDPRRRWRRFDPAVLARLAVLSQGTADELLLDALARHPLVGAAELLRRADVDAAAGEKLLDDLIHSGAVHTLPVEGGEAVLIALQAWQAVLRVLDESLAAYHRQYPLRRGAPRGEVRSRLQAAPALKGATGGASTTAGTGKSGSGRAGAGGKGSASGATGSAAGLPVRLFNAVVAAAHAAGQIGADDAVIWQANFQPTLDSRQAAAAAGLLARFDAAPYLPPTHQETLAALGEDAELLAFLVDGGELARIGGDVLLRPAALAAMFEGITAHLRAHGSITLAETRDLFQTSRKYAQAVLEEMDARRLTRREGEGRVLR